MVERTSDEIAAIFSAAGDSVTVIADANYSAYVTRTASLDTEAEWKTMIQRNVEHLEIIKAYKKLDETTSIWTSEDFTDIDAAITAGKKLY
jgi:metal-dependent amidase/aminoacylase/carboxypeptidase family protein